MQANLTLFATDKGYIPPIIWGNIVAMIDYPPRIEQPYNSRLCY